MKTEQHNFPYACRILIAIMLFAIPMLFTACQPKTIEQQVEALIETNKWQTQREIAHALADSLNPRAVELLVALYPHDHNAEIALSEMMERYEEIVNEEIITETKPTRAEKVYECVGMMPLQEAAEFLGIQAVTHNAHTAFSIIKNMPIMQKRFALIAGLKIETENSAIQDSLITEIKALYDDLYAQYDTDDIEGMKKLIELWAENPDAQGLQRTVASYGQVAVNYLCLDIDGNAELLARLGETSLSTLISKMKNKDVAVRYAAAKALVLMTKYEPQATSDLIEAFDNSNLGAVANNYPFYIRLGRAGTESLLLKALKYKFSTKMCLDFLNCGNAEMESGATDIAHENGYIVFTEYDSRHDGPIWGSGN
jgi:hypothetical protein